MCSNKTYLPRREELGPVRHWAQIAGAEKIWRKKRIEEKKENRGEAIFVVAKLSSSHFHAASLPIFHAFFQCSRGDKPHLQGVDVVDADWPSEASPLSCVALFPIWPSGKPSP